LSVEGSNGASPGAFHLDDLLRRPEQLERLPPCQAGCPSGTDIRRWIGFLAQRDKLGLDLDEACRRAFAVIADRNPFPAVLGRICPHPCESGCNREGLDGAVSVNALERFVGDRALELGVDLPRLEPAPKPASVGVVGAGPAGLSFAYQMARRGHRVTVYERGARAGGMLLRGIPEYRLPEAVLVAEIGRLLRLGIELRTGEEVRGTAAHHELRRRHDVVFLGVGAQSGRRLGVDGEDGPGVLSGVEFLRDVNAGREAGIGRRVVVVGGGNTAVDAARSARRLGSEVVLAYRRTRAEMPASDTEVDEALEEGVELECLVAPLAVLREEGRVRALRLGRMRLGTPDASGRARPEPIAGSEVEIAVDSVVVAVSQGVDDGDLAGLPSAGGFLTPLQDGELGGGLWTGGDAIGLGIATLAIAQGRKAAEAVDARLRCAVPPGADLRPPAEGATVRPGLYERADRARASAIGVAERLADPDAEVVSTLDEEQAVAEAARCLSCGSCFGCGQCAMYCNPGGFTRLAEVAPGSYYALDLRVCEGCGKCLEVCPCGFLSAR